jgi:hypothetical protein
MHRDDFRSQDRAIFCEGKLLIAQTVSLNLPLIVGEFAQHAVSGPPEAATEPSYHQGDWQSQTSHDDTA